jgi:hypothetical protein
MFTNLILLILFAGVPYFLLFETKTKIKLKPEKIFFLSATLVVLGMFLSSLVSTKHSDVLAGVSLVSAMYAFHKASQTTNFYKFAYYLLFVNAPILMMFDPAQSFPYAISLIITLLGVYFIGRHYEQNYGSANYQPITGTIIVTPFVGGFLSIYLITLALYPPFPNAIFFLHTIYEANLSFLWFITVLFVFFANFILAMRIMGKTVFGKPNSNIHYVGLEPKEKVIHFVLFTLLLLLTLWEIKEILA